MYAQIYIAKNANVLNEFLIDFLISLMFDMKFENFEKYV